VQTEFEVKRGNFNKKYE